MSIRIRRTTWVEVYNAIVIFQYVADLFERDADALQRANDHYRGFLQSHRLSASGSIDSLYGRSNIFSFAYLIIVRLLEVVDAGCYSRTDRDTFLREVIAEWNRSLSVDNFESLKSAYEIRISEFKKLVPGDSEETAVYKFLESIRSAISHFRYAFKGIDVEFRDQVTHHDEMNFTLSMPLVKFFSFTADFAACMNNCLHAGRYLSDS
jgi:hypothetical protein